MTDEMNQRLVQWGEKLVEKIEAGADWTAGQAGDVAQQYVSYTLVYSSIMLAIGIAGIILCGIVIKWCITNRERSEGFIFAGMMAGLVLIGVSITTAQELEIVIKAKVAPKVLVLEKVRDIINGR